MGANILPPAGIVAFVQLVPAAEFSADGVPEQLHDLDTLLVADPVGAADVTLQIRLDRGIGEILHRRRQINQRRGHSSFDYVLDPGIGIRREHAVCLPGLQFRQHGVTLPRVGIIGHGIGQRPEQVAPGHDLPQQHLITARFVSACAAQGFGQQAGDEIQFNRETGAALELEAIGEPRARVEA